MKPTVPKYKCPACGRHERVLIEVEKWVQVFHDDHDGTVESMQIDDDMPLGNGDMDYEGHSRAMCGYDDCMHYATVQAFINPDYNHEDEDANAGDGLPEDED